MKSLPDLRDLVNLPIFQAPTGSIAGPELATEVCLAGGVGAMALTWTEPSTAAEYVQQVRKATSSPFLVNFALAFPPIALDCVLEAGAPIVSFSWGDPRSYLDRVHAAGALCSVQVSSAAAAKLYSEAGFDFLVCQGYEAGGHVQATRPLWSLLPEVIAAANGVPVVAAGGLGCGADIGHALTLGAFGAMLGTRFVATLESRAHPYYRELLTSARSSDTALTVCFDGGWPYSVHRVLRNSTLDAWETFGCPPVGSRPGESEVVGFDAAGDSIQRYAGTAPRSGFTGEIEAMCLYAGTSVDTITDISPAADVVRMLWTECTLWLEQRAAAMASC